MCRAVFGWDGSSGGFGQEHSMSPKAPTVRHGPAPLSGVPLSLWSRHICSRPWKVIPVWVFRQNLPCLLVRICVLLPGDARSLLFAGTSLALPRPSRSPE